MTDNIKERVIASCIRALKESSEMPEKIGEDLRGLLTASKLPKAEAFVTLFEQHSKDLPRDSA